MAVHRLSRAAGRPTGRQPAPSPAGPRVTGGRRRRPGMRLHRTPVSPRPAIWPRSGRGRNPRTPPGTAAPSPTASAFAIARRGTGRAGPRRRRPDGTNPDQSQPGGLVPFAPNAPAHPGTAQRFPPDPLQPVRIPSPRSSQARPKLPRSRPPRAGPAGTARTGRSTREMRAPATGGSTSPSRPGTRLTGEGTGPVGRPAGRKRDVFTQGRLAWGRCTVPNQGHEPAARAVHGLQAERPVVTPAASGGAWARGRREKRIAPSLILPYRRVTTSRA